MTRICTECRSEKDDSKFYKHPSIKPDGVRKRCNDCVQSYRRRSHKENPQIKRNQANGWSMKNREKINENARLVRKNNKQRFKSYALKQSFGIDINEFNRMLELQNHVCAICNLPETNHQKGIIKALSVDHNRKCCPGNKSCGKCIRGLLCWHCNSGIGKLKDSSQLLRKAADYIDNN